MTLDRKVTGNEAEHSQHMTEELKRQQSKTVLIALHPGEVAT